MNAKKISKKVEQQLENGNFCLVKYEISSEKQRMKKLEDLIAKHDCTPCVIYCRKAYADRICKIVDKYYPGQAVKYCANKKQSKSVELFLKGERRFMIATSTILKNISKLDIRLVIHTELPVSMIDYCRQIGPAGHGAECVLLYQSDLDLLENKAYLQATIDDDKYLRPFQDLAWMGFYSQSDFCLRQQLPGLEDCEPCGICTNCRKSKT